MANSTNASNQSTVEHSASLAGALRPHEKTGQALARRDLPGAFLLASMLATMAGGAATTALGAGLKPGAACAAEDLSAFDVIEERSEVIGTSTKQVLEAVRKFVQARRLCLSGQQHQGIALYQNAINTALGFDTPAVSEMARITSAAAIQMPPPSR